MNSGCTGCDDDIFEFMEINLEQAPAQNQIISFNLCVAVQGLVQTSTFSLSSGTIGSNVPLHHDFILKILISKLLFLFPMLNSCICPSHHNVKQSNEHEILSKTRGDVSLGKWNNYSMCICFCARGKGGRGRLFEYYIQCA